LRLRRLRRRRGGAKGAGGLTGPPSSIWASFGGATRRSPTISAGVEGAKPGGKKRR